MRSLFSIFPLLLSILAIFSVPTTSSAYVEYNCSVSYTNGCKPADKVTSSAEDEKDVNLMPEEKALAYRPNPYRAQLKGKKLPPNFEVDHLGYPTYFTPDAPVEFREMIKEPTELNVRAYINSMAYQASRHERINGMIKSVGAKIKKENVQRLEQDLKDGAANVALLVFLRASTSSYLQSENILKSIAALRNEVGSVAIKYYFTDPVSSFDEKFSGFSPYSSITEFIKDHKLPSPLLVDEESIKTKMDLKWVPSLIVVDRTSGALTKVMGHEPSNTIRNKVLGFLKMIARNTKASKARKAATSGGSLSSKGLK